MKIKSLTMFFYDFGTYKQTQVKPLPVHEEIERFVAIMDAFEDDGEDETR